MQNQFLFFCDISLRKSWFVLHMFLFSGVLSLEVLQWRRRRRDLDIAHYKTKNETPFAVISGVIAQGLYTNP